MPRRDRKPGRATIALHGGLSHLPAGSPVVQPLMQSANAVVVQQRLALLEGAEDAVVLASGMGATACTMIALLRPGDHLLASEWCYGGTRRFFGEELATLGIEVSFVDPLEPREWRRELRDNTRAIFVETPVNPTCRVLDMAPLSMMAKLEGVALVVDSTFASPINFRPIEHGADVVIHSATKYLNGHHDIVAGVVAGTSPFIDEVKGKMAVWGQSPDPFACWMLERGLKTLEVRIRRQNESAMEVANWCKGNPAISKVWYPGLPDHPDHSIATRTLDGFGGMLAIQLAGGGGAVAAFLRKLSVFTHAASLGGVESLAIEPRYSSHEHMSKEDRERIGIPDGFIRLSIGLEDPGDLIADMENALT